MTAERFLDDLARTMAEPMPRTVSGALGADGTPMAVLVSADGRIASPVAGGGPAVLDLLGIGELAAAH